MSRSSVVVLAADVTGAEIVEWLSGQDYNLAYVGTHHLNPGWRNNEIRRHAPATQWGSLADIPFQPDIGVLAWWPEIIREPILSLPRLGWVNLHPSYLPFNRGKNPNFWALATGTTVGATLHFADRGMDTGPILARAQVPTDWTDTGKTVHAKTREACVSLFKEHFDLIASEALKATRQAQEGSTHFSGDMDRASQLALREERPLGEWLDLLRARTFPPHPACWFKDGEDEYEVRVEITRRKA